MATSSRIKTQVLAVWMAIACLGLGSRAQAQVTCGQIITGKATMTADLECPNHSPVLIISGGELDMGGHVLHDCKPGAIGISITGKGATLRNGAVVGCETGVRAGGEGSHTITRMVATYNSNHGFESTSPNNRFIDNSASHNGQYGFYVHSEEQPMRVTLTRNSVAGQNDYAFRVEGDGCKLTDNVATSVTHGFYVGGNKNTLKHNTAAETNGYGIVVTGEQNSVNQSIVVYNVLAGLSLSGDRNTALGTISLNNGGAGIDLLSTKSKVERSVVAANGDDGINALQNGAKVNRNRVVDNLKIGIDTLDPSNDMAIGRNQVMANGADGINIGGSSSLITYNTAIGNALYDADDNHFGCSGNVWANNLVGLASQFCIQ